jgi:hypothetical protein
MRAGSEINNKKLMLKKNEVAIKNRQSRDTSNKQNKKKHNTKSWSSCPFFIKFIKMTKATIVNFFYRSYQVLLTDVVIIHR